MSLAYRCLLCGGWPSRDASGAAVIAHIINRDVIHDRLVVHVGNVPHVVYGTVVEEDSAVPISALVAETVIAKTVKNAAVESDVRAQ